MAAPPAPTRPGSEIVRRLADVCIVVISAVLLAGIIVDRLLPALLFSALKARYVAEVAQCDDAKRDSDLVESRLIGDIESDIALRKAARVHAFSCIRAEALKNALLDWGVREASLRGVELGVVSSAAKSSSTSDPGGWSTALLRLFVADALDSDLERAIKEFDVRPLEVRRFEPDPSSSSARRCFLIRSLVARGMSHVEAAISSRTARVMASRDPLVSAATA